MKKEKKEALDDRPEGSQGPALDAVTAGGTAEMELGTGGSEEGALVEPVEEQVRRLTDELAHVKDQYLRLAADLDNFRKRVTKERAETWARAQADVVSNILDGLDDLARVAQLDPAKTSSRDVLAGVELVERKLLKELDGAGLERVGQVGEPFDPNRHEAVSTVPAAAQEEDHIVSAVFQAGYRFGGALLRPAKVQVRIWSGSE